MLPTITTTHAVPDRLPATHLFSTGKVKFCSQCLTVMNAGAELRGKGKRKASHRCDDRAAAHKPSVSVPFS